MNFIPSYSRSAASKPQPFWHQGPVSWETIFPQTGVGVGRGLVSGQLPVQARRLGTPALDDLEEN